MCVCLFLETSHVGYRLEMIGVLFVSFGGPIVFGLGLVAVPAAPNLSVDVVAMAVLFTELTISVQAAENNGCGGESNSIWVSFAIFYVELNDERHLLSDSTRNDVNAILNWAANNKEL